MKMKELGPVSGGGGHASDAMLCNVILLFLEDNITNIA